MKKSWIILVLIIIIAAEWTVMSSFQSVSAVSMESGTRAAVISKLNYMNVKATIEISPRQYPVVEPVLVKFSNGSELEINEKYSFDVFLPKSGSINGDFYFGKVLTSTPLPSDEVAQIRLNSESPIDADITPDVPEDFMSWYGEQTNPYLNNYDDEIDIYWLIVEGEATIAISGYGAPF